MFNLPGRELQERIAQCEDLGGKVRLLQQFLLQRFAALDKSDPITDYAMDRILTSGGLIRINDLCDEIGYSRRYLLARFADHVGLSPKEYSCLVRFNRIYKSINVNPIAGQNDDAYHDQSHLIREFKKFTGLTPGEYLRRSNRLGTVFFSE